MLIAALVACLAQAPAPPAAPDGTSLRPALATLAAKAPGQPGYGLHITTAEGAFIATNLRYDAEKPDGAASLYRIAGPAGMGPYRLGAELAFRSQGRAQLPNGTLVWVNPRFRVMKVVPGGAAERAGLDDDWEIMKVDGRVFDGSLEALVSYLTNRPLVDVQAYKHKGWGSKKEKHFEIHLVKEEKAADPADGRLVEEPVERVPALASLFGAQTTWSELIRLRSQHPRFRAVQVEGAGETLWAVQGVPKPVSVVPAGRSRGRAFDEFFKTGGSGGSGAGPTFLEFWSEDPAAGPRQTKPVALWAEPADGLRPNRLLRLRTRWFRIQEVALEPPDGGLARLRLQPWTPDIPSLIAGATLAQDLGPRPDPALREALEQLANEDLVAWKTRTLPGVLASQSLASAEELVVSLEKGLLTLDLDVKGIRTRLDAAARAEAERKAQAELTGRQGRPAPAALPPSAESERLADLLDQRKAILMAILGNAKQSLASLRR
ncbi:PDZ domain-containing protein [Geothrix sp. SG200]|uniref:PDZ domain-containing protein n=1 Tax=Geothrix sp. SG200 TaxID=2922865 RepID=UPI001FAE5E3E|nr:PDZ domain-containing protein [Geothrix sp. SG200]